MKTTKKLSLNKSTLTSLEKENTKGGLLPIIICTIILSAKNRCTGHDCGNW